jgi:putative transcriptional regulator
VLFLFHEGGTKMQLLLYKIRKHHRLTQSDMANILNICSNTYGSKERGEYEFTQDEMFILADYFCKKVDEIFLPRCYRFGNLTKAMLPT